MDYSYDSYSSITTSRIKKNMENALKNLNPNALKWIADNREYGEKGNRDCRHEGGGDRRPGPYYFG